MKLSTSFGRGLAGFAVLMTPCASTHSLAQSVWVAPGDGRWADSANWLGSVPTIDVAVAITNAGTKVVALDGGTPVVHRAARRLDLSAPAGTTNTLRLVDLGDAPFQLTNSCILEAGSRLELIRASLLLDGSLGGSFSQVAGDVTLLEASLRTTNGAGLRIGRAGVGQAAVSRSSLVAGADLIVGGLAGGDGTLVLSDGLVQVGGQLTIGDDPGAVGYVGVTAGVFIATNATARVGDDGDGTFAQSGGQVLLDGVSVGRASNAVGRLELRGGVMVPGSLSIGRFAGSRGTLEVSGGTLDLAADTLYVGREGEGVAILSGGAVRAATVLLAASNTASGTLRLSGGTLTTGQLIAHRPSAQFEFLAGTLEITQAAAVANGAALVVGDGVQPAVLRLGTGTHSFAQGLVISSNATLQGSGTVVGAVTVLPGGANQLGASPAVALTPAQVDGGFRLSFPSTAGVSYEVLSAADPADPVWQVDTTITGTGATLTYTNTSTASPRFFRVRTH